MGKFKNINVEDQERMLPSDDVLENGLTLDEYDSVMEGYEEWVNDVDNNASVDDNYMDIESQIIDTVVNNYSKSRSLDDIHNDNGKYPIGNSVGKTLGNVERSLKVIKNSDNHSNSYINGSILLEAVVNRYSYDELLDLRTDMTLSGDVKDIEWNDLFNNRFNKDISNKLRPINIGLSDCNVSLRPDIIQSQIDCVNMMREETGIIGNEPGLPSYDAERLFNGMNNIDMKSSIVRSIYDKKANYAQEYDELRDNVIKAYDNLIDANVSVRLDKNSKALIATSYKDYENLMHLNSDSKETNEKKERRLPDIDNIEIDMSDYEFDM